MTEDITIIVAEQAEENMILKHYPGIKCIRTGVGASNVIKTCCRLPEGSRIFNIGYAGSNKLPVGTVTFVSETRRLMSDDYKFEDYHNPLAFGAQLQEKGYPCYTSNSFVTRSDIVEPVLFDMELNYIAAFPLQLEGSIKIVSDNLCVDSFMNNAIRETGILTSEKVWNQVFEMFENLNIR